MTTSTGGFLAKLILCIWNMAFVVVAVCLILVGTHKFLVPEDEHDGTYVLGFSWGTISTTFIIIGAIAAIASLTGLAGAACESPFLLKSYVYFIISALATILSLIIANWLFGDQFLDKADNYFSELMVNSSSSHGDFVAANAINTWQKVAMCCGKDGPSDWNNMTIVEENHGNKNGSKGSIISISKINYPISCCGEAYVSEANGKNMTNASSGQVCDEANLLYHEGCFSVPLVEWYKLMHKIIISVVLGVLSLLLSLACCLDRERKLGNAKLINAQYAAHLKSCISLKGPSKRRMGNPIRAQDISTF